MTRLTAEFVETVTKPGSYADGQGLYLQVGRGGAKSWIFRYMIRGRARYMGLGSFATVTLAEARRERDRHRRALKNDGVDPLIARRGPVDVGALVADAMILARALAGQNQSAEVRDAIWRIRLVAANLG